jgi:CheY-like chemotaxis protein
MALRVLVADDDPDTADTLAVLLGIGGHRPFVAYDGPSALAAALRERPDVVVLDLKMPRLDGFAVIRRIHDTPGVEGLPVIALTGLGEAGVRRRCREAGFFTHLLKPVEPDELLEVLARSAHQCSAR